MVAAALQTLFDRDLQKLRLEIESYRSEAAIWRVEQAISNSPSNLGRHLIGNLNTYIGAEPGRSGYVRHRELEFSPKDVPDGFHVLAYQKAPPGRLNEDGRRGFTLTGTAISCG